MGQLGNKNTYDTNVPIKIDRTWFQNEKIVQVGVGYSHVIFVTANGLLFGTGKNCGQSNPNELCHVPTRINAIAISKKFVRACAGEDFNIVQATDGKLYSFGSNTNGMQNIIITVLQGVLGINELRPGFFNPVQTVFTAGTFFESENVTQFECGAKHVLVLFASGRLMAWGSNCMYSMYLLPC